LLLLRNVVLLGSQAVIWSDLHLVSMDAANYHPRSPRALLELAQVYARDQNLEGALELLDRAPVSAGGGELEPALLRAIFRCMASAPVPPSLLQELRAQQSHLKNRRVGENVYHLVRLLINGECPGADATVLAEQLRVIMEAEGVLRGTPKIYAAMILLENHLARYSRGLEYVDLLLARQPENVMGLQFQLQFATALELESLRKDAEKRLRALRDAGRLSREESYNLGLFLDQPG
jgi:hypothetical protein